MVAVLLAAVVLMHLGSVFLYHSEAVTASDTVVASQVAGRLAVAVGALGDTDPARRDGRAHALSSSGLSLFWGDRPVAPPRPALGGGAHGLREHILRLAPELAGSDLRVGTDGAGAPETLLGSVRLPDGTYLNFTAGLDHGVLGPAYATLLSTSLVAVGVAGVAGLFLRRLVRPIQELSRAADAIGRGPRPVAVDEAGPREVRHLARAFNAMQARIRRLVEDRTTALAAVSHDLRTPITRLRLRAGFLDDPDARAAVDADLDEMEAMIEATLSYLRGEEEAEAPRGMDLAATVRTLVDDAADRGLDAGYAGPDHLAAVLRPFAIKRAVANVIGNALTYGGAAAVTLQAAPGAARIRVDDPGPGIPEGDMERVFEPFQRLETSRNRASGGVGLGLAIARRAVLHEGGTITLLNRPGGGLRAEIVLPVGGGAGHTLSSGPRTVDTFARHLPRRRRPLGPP